MLFCCVNFVVVCVLVRLKFWLFVNCSLKIFSGLISCLVLLWVGVVIVYSVMSGFLLFVLW